MKSKVWLERQKRDVYVSKAKIEGYSSRAAFKLLEINKKFNIISSSNNILEFGSSPGGWSQVILEINKKSKIYAFDLLDMDYSHPNIYFIKGDFLKYNFDKEPNKFDLILSDIAPNTTGHKSTDHLKIVSMIEEIIYIVDKIALPSSNFICKLWKGSEELNIIKKLKQKYNKVSYFKPKSSRVKSSEIYIVAQKYIK